MDQNYTTMQLAETKLKLNQVLTRIQNDLIYHIYIQARIATKGQGFPLLLYIFTVCFLLCMFYIFSIDIHPAHSRYRFILMWVTSAYTGCT